MRVGITYLPGYTLLPVEVNFWTFIQNAQRQQQDKFLKNTYCQKFTITCPHLQEVLYLSGFLGVEGETWVELVDGFWWLQFYLKRIVTLYFTLWKLTK